MDQLPRLLVEEEREEADGDVLRLVLGWVGCGSGGG